MSMVQMNVDAATLHRLIPNSRDVYAVLNVAVSA